MEQEKKENNKLAIWEKESNWYPEYGYQFLGEEPCSMEGLQKFAQVILDDNIRRLLGLTQRDVLRSMSACQFLRKKLREYQSRFWGAVNPKYQGMKGEKVFEKQEAKVLSKEIVSIKGKLERRKHNLEKTKEEIEKFARRLKNSTGTEKVSLRGKIQRREEKLPKLEQDVEEHQHLLDYKMEQREEKKRKIKK